MALVRNENRGRDAAVLGRAAPASRRIVRWAVVSGAGTGVAALSLTALSGLVFLALSLASPVDFAPYAHKNAAPDRLALAAAPYALPTHQACGADCAQRTQYIVQQAKSPRRNTSADSHIDAASLARAETHRRFEIARASLANIKLASLFAEARPSALAALQAHASPRPDRFNPGNKVAALAAHDGPAANRFGPKIPEIERSSRLALALAGSGTLHVAYPVQTASLGPAMPVLAPMVDEDAATDMAGIPAFELVPDNAPLPARRPKTDTRKPSPAAIAEAAPEKPRQPSKPTRRGSEQQALAYAAPDDDAPSIGQAFKNLFSTPKSGVAARNGVAVYDISAQTVTMPDGQVLEAHSGIGHMADDPRYANQKMNGPTPPNTYKLVMRESRFHGVEAIRMLPVDSKKMHGRTGILAHSYLLRGRAGQSHGCVAFADYDRFLQAFKRGKVKHLVVVPGRRAKASTRIAKNGSGA